MKNDTGVDMMQKAPICGALSLAIPVGIIGLFIYGMRHLGWGQCSTGLSMLLPIVLLGPVHIAGGIGFGIAGLKRKERWRWFSRLGILFGAYPLIVLAVSWIVAEI